MRDGRPGSAANSANIIICHELGKLDEYKNGCENCGSDEGKGQARSRRGSRSVHPRAAQRERGNRVKSVVAGVTTVALGDYFKWTGKPHPACGHPPHFSEKNGEGWGGVAGAQRVAVRTGSSSNLVVNPGFESSGNWSEVRVTNCPGTSFYRSTWGTAAPKSGAYAYAISNHVSGELRSDPLPVAGGAEYDLYAFVRGEHDPHDSHGGWRLRVNYYDAGGTYISYQDAFIGTVDALTTIWGYKGGRISTPANAASLRIRLYTYQNSGWIAFDDISLTKVSDYQSTTLSYNAEPRLVGTSGAVTASFIYDGDGRGLCTPQPRSGERGNRAKSVVGGSTMVTIGNYFEWTGKPRPACGHPPQFSQKNGEGWGGGASQGCISRSVLCAQRLTAAR